MLLQYAASTKKCVSVMPRLNCLPIVLTTKPENAPPTRAIPRLMNVAASWWSA